MPSLSSGKPRKVTDVLSREELRDLTARSDLAGAAAVAWNWGFTLACLGGLARWPGPLSFVLVVILLGGRQLGFAVLAHEAAHRTLFRRRWFNDVLANWLCGYPVWTDVTRYRKHHRRHHSHTGTPDDPDLCLVSPFPASPASLTRKLLRDVLGLSGLRRIVGLLAMDFGVLEYNAAGDVRRRPHHGRRARDDLMEGLRHVLPVLVCNLVLLAVLAVFDAAWTYSAWIVAYLSSFSLFLRVRSIAEHACAETGADPFRNTSTTRAGWLARLTVAPFGVNYHLEHHLMASVPFYRLHKLHAMLRREGAVQPLSGYVQVLRLAAGYPAR